MVVLLMAGSVAADQPAVEPQLVVDRARLEPGGTLTLGVQFEIAPGWHIYWKNPGDSGLATEVSFALPPGFEIGELQWPLPVEFVQPGDLKAYGYSGDVLLGSEVELPQRVSTRFQVTAEVSWLACKEKCVLGSVELVETLPPDPARAEADRAAFERWRRELPIPVNESELPFTLSVTGGVAAGERMGEVSVWLWWLEPPALVEWFPENGAGLETGELRIRRRGDLTRIDVEVSRVGTESQTVDRLSSVLVAVDQQGRRRGWQVEIPVQTTS